MRAFLPALLLGCGADHDYLVSNVPASAYGSATSTAPGVQLTADAAASYTDWGGGTFNCSIRLAFMLDRHEAEQQTGTPGDVIEMATEPGSCAVSHFEPGEPPAAMEFDPPAFLDVGEAVRLSDAVGEIELVRVESADGTTQTYELSACDADRFPFGRVLDLVLPEGVGPVPPLTVSRALVMPPAVTMLAPVPEELVDNAFPQSVADDLLVAWEPGATTWSEGEFPISTSVTLRNADADADNQIVDAVNCLPHADSSDVQVPPEVLAEVATDPDDPDRYAFSAQVDLRVQGHDLQLPWGQEARMSTNVAVTGNIDLSEAQD